MKQLAYSVGSPAPHGIDTVQDWVKRVTGQPGYLVTGGFMEQTKVKLLVMHATAGGTLSGAIRTLLDVKLSYHFLIDRDGKIYKCVSKNTRVAWHAGNSYGPREHDVETSTERARNGKFKAGCSVNTYSIGVSFVNKDDGVQKITKAQMESAIWLGIQLKSQFPNLETVTTHSHVSPAPRKFDPKGFPLKRFAAALGMKVWQNTIGVQVDVDEALSGILDSIWKPAEKPVVKPAPQPPAVKPAQISPGKTPGKK